VQQENGQMQHSHGIRWRGDGKPDIMIVNESRRVELGGSSR